VLTVLRRTLAVLVPTAAVVALAVPASAATATPQVLPVAGPAPVTQGIIMRDGGVCDPIRHMGC
jgi:hypothetical protein